ncbi:hypothetical protein CIRMBP1271_00260 [Enterococcus cecorum]|nr:hypothetical protein [Enterococcus cecorum]CAI3252636.1 hypothetical protein CIRMBP1255_00035 [Enterococcus cecorum]CAI3266408.1 hypothetical protein CIRMBP1225_00215 [Enterococcus cecorum]CAI3267925.1 hypothetical protein CIRMBP1226_00253 [Enterococcus cecorum]CAI3268719.1 hypothetical protein CIRMBP1232_00254 [Enterococcus cecorum]CAI3269046.1 hypothetical protein CIRMBP1240_00254 [Enterococcus cecorum]
MSKKFKLGLTSALIAGSSVAAYQLAKKDKQTRQKMLMPKKLKPND